MNKNFKLGKIIITEKVCEMFWYSTISNALAKYLRCDWGIVNESDASKNDYAVKIGAGKIFACYRTFTGRKFWIVTEHNKTTVSLAGEEIAK